MSKGDIIEDAISKMEEEVIRIQCEMEKLEKRMGRIREKRIMANIRRGENDGVVIM